MNLFKYIFILTALLAMAACGPAAQLDDDGFSVPVINSELKADMANRFTIDFKNADFVQTDLDAPQQALAESLTDAPSGISNPLLAHALSSNNITSATLSRGEKKISAPIYLIKSKQPFVAWVPQLASPWPGMALLYRRQGEWKNPKEGWEGLLTVNGVGQDQFTSVWIDPASGRVACRGVNEKNKAVAFFDAVNLGSNVEIGLVVGYNGKLEKEVASDMPFELVMAQLSDSGLYWKWVHSRQGVINSKCANEADCNSYVYEGNGKTFSMRCVPTEDLAYKVCAEHSPEGGMCNDRSDCVSGYCSRSFTCY